MPCLHVIILILLFLNLDLELGNHLRLKPRVLPVEPLVLFLQIRRFLLERIAKAILLVVDDGAIVDRGSLGVLKVINSLYAARSGDPTSARG